MEITRKEFEEKTLDELCKMLIENGENITTFESLKDFAKDKIDDDNLFLTIHICNALNLAQDFFPEANYYIYDYSMGTLETPSAVTSKEDIERLFRFKKPLTIRKKVEKIPNNISIKRKIFDMLDLEYNDHYTSYIDYMREECDDKTSSVEELKDLYLSHEWCITSYNTLNDLDEAYEIAQLNENEIAAIKEMVGA